MEWAMLFQLCILLLSAPLGVLADANAPAAADDDDADGNAVFVSWRSCVNHQREPLCEALGLPPVRLLPIALGLHARARRRRRTSRDVLQPLPSPASAVRWYAPPTRASTPCNRILLPSPGLYSFCSVVPATVFGFSSRPPLPPPQLSPPLSRDLSSIFRGRHPLQPPSCSC
jgi:hypothetical protein